MRERGGGEIERKKGREQWGRVERGSLTTAHQVHDKPTNVRQYQVAIS